MKQRRARVPQLLTLPPGPASSHPFLRFLRLPQEMHEDWEHVKGTAAEAGREAQHEAQKLFSGAGDSGHAQGSTVDWIKEKAREMAPQAAALLFTFSVISRFDLP